MSNSSSLEDSGLDYYSPGDEKDSEDELPEESDELDEEISVT